MSFVRHFAVAALAAAALTGCRHANTAPVVQTQAPAINTVHVTPPPAGNPLSTQSAPPLPSLPPTTENASEHAPKPPPRTRHHRKPKPAATTASIGTQPAPATAAAPPLASRDINPPMPTPASGAPTATGPAAAPAAAIPPAETLGTLSTGDVSAGATARRTTVALIDSTASGLNNLKRALTLPDQQTATQIRSFLQKAKAALDSDDLDGANTLATKAKVLLDELTKQ